MSYRIDKYLWSVRLAKTRSQAAELISKGKVRLNGSVVKPAREVKESDQISITRNTAVFSYKVLGLLDKRVGARLVSDYILDTTPAEELEKYRLYRAAQSQYREYGTGKPSKKDRRDLDEFLEDW